MDLVVENEEQPSTGQYEAQSGTPRNAPDRIRTGDLRLERRRGVGVGSEIRAAM